MSTTEYARKHVLRLDDEGRHTLMRALAVYVTDLQELLQEALLRDASSEATRGFRMEIRSGMSLMDQLSD